MKNIRAFFLGILTFLFIGVHGIWAVTTSISNAPSVIGQDPFNLTVSITGAKAAKNYLQVDIYKEGTSEYIGQTFNTTDWYDREDATKYFPIDITGSETNIATLSARLNSIPSNWSGQDNFRIRVRRYTASGSYTSTEAEASAIPISITIPTQTPPPTGGPSPTPLLSSSPSPTLPIPSITPSSPLVENVFITEVMVAPDIGQNEWVELYNDNNEPVTLINWYIDDAGNSGSSPKQFSATVDPHAYAIVEFSSALFNNDGDSVRLLNNSQQQQDYITYTLSERGKSIGRNDINSRSVCIEISSKNQNNSTCVPELLTTNYLLLTSPPIPPGVLEESLDISSSEGQLDDIMSSNTITKIPLNRPLVGDKSQEPTPLNIQGELNSPIVRSLFPQNDLSGLVKATATSSAGISLLNIAYILYRMKKWHLSEM